MGKIEQLLEEYRCALSSGVVDAPADERGLYELHMQSLEQLAALLSADSPAGAIAVAVASERRSFGWSYLSGAGGERVERAFHTLASELERLYPGAARGA